jgi:gluconate 2-dehydrogenase gamma chain
VSSRHRQSFDLLKLEHDDVVAALKVASSKSKQAVPGTPHFDPTRLETAIATAGDAYALLLIATAESFLREYLDSIAAPISPDPKLSKLVDKSAKELNARSPAVAIRPKDRSLSTISALIGTNTPTVMAAACSQPLRGSPPFWASSSPRFLKRHGRLLVDRNRREDVMMHSVPLTDSHWRTLAAVVDRIVPVDEWPSASGAGVLDFFRRLLPSEDLEERYASGLDSIDAEAKAVYGKAFAACDDADQDALLRQIERGRVRTEWREKPKPFFALLASQTIEGYYADPGNGGNRDGVAWDMVGFRVSA